jgi:hypothetical protein
LKRGEYGFPSSASPRGCCCHRLITEFAHSIQHRLVGSLSLPHFHLLLGRMKDNEMNTRIIINHNYQATLQTQPSFKLIIPYDKARRKSKLMFQNLIVYFCAYFLLVETYARPLLWSSGLDPEVRVRFPTLPDFLRSNGSGMGSTQSRGYN